MRLVFDIEANGLYEDATKIWCICAQDLDTGETYEWTRSERPNKDNSISNVLSVFSTADELIGHNIINYDLPLIKKLVEWTPNESTKITDTLVMSRLLNPDRARPYGYTGKGGPHSLEAWGYRVGKGKPDHEDWHVFSAAMLHRCREDVVINASTYSALTSEIADHDWTEALRLEYEMARIMTEQERAGIYFDKEKAEEYVSWLSDRIEQIDAEIVPRLPGTVEQIGSVPINNPFLKTGGYRKQTQDYLDEAYQGKTSIYNLVGGPFTRIRFLPFNLGSTEKVKSYLLESGWQPDSWNYSKKTGERTSPKLEGEFRGISGDIPQRVKERITWRHRRSQIEGWLKNVREDGRLPAGANPCGTNTGRMRHMTVVNVPKANTDKKTGKLIWDTDKQKDIFGTQMRSLFTVPEGYKLVGHDASGLELRMLAHYMNDQEFTDAILEGDIHEFNRAKAGLPYRDDAKTFIYGFLYGAGDAKIGSIVGGDAASGAELRGSFLAGLPKLEKLINTVKRASGKGFLKGLDNRKIMMRRGEDGRIMRHKALNTLLQAAGAVVMKQSAILLDQYVKENNIRGFKVLDMHDEAQWQIHEDDVELYCELAVKSIVDAGEYFNLNIPLTAEAKVGMTMAETH